MHPHHWRTLDGKRGFSSLCVSKAPQTINKSLSPFTQTLSPRHCLGITLWRETTEYALAFSRPLFIGKGHNAFAICTLLMLVGTGISQNFSHYILRKLTAVFISPNVRKQNSLQQRKAHYDNIIPVPYKKDLTISWSSIYTKKFVIRSEWKGKIIYLQNTLGNWIKLWLYLPRTREIAMINILNVKI